jgi:hypothetical protein
MRPFVAFFGFVLTIPGWDLLAVNRNGSCTSGFATPSGMVVWTVTGRSPDSHFVHAAGLLILLTGAVIAVIGVITSPHKPDSE